MIYTITLHPALDYYLSFQEQKISNHQVATSANYFPGGKGINAAKLLTNFDAKNVAITIAGGCNGKRVVELARAHKLTISNIDPASELRINVKTNFNNKTFEQNVRGKVVHAQAVNKKIMHQLEQLQAHDAVMIMGSLPVGYGIADLETIIKFITRKKAQLVIDFPDRSIIQLLKYKPLIIKPNQKELEQIFKTKIKTTHEIKKHARQLLARGARQVIVSLDQAGALYVDRDQSFKINVPVITEINSAGAGDAMLAMFLYASQTNNHVIDCLKLAASAGVATAASRWIAAKDQIQQYINKIQVKEI